MVSHCLMLFVLPLLVRRRQSDILYRVVENRQFPDIRAIQPLSNFQRRASEPTLTNLIPALLHALPPQPRMPLVARLGHADPKLVEQALRHLVEADQRVHLLEHVVISRHRRSRVPSWPVQLIVCTVLQAEEFHLALVRVHIGQAEQTRMRILSPLLSPATGLAREAQFARNAIDVGVRLLLRIVAHVEGDFHAVAFLDPARDRTLGGAGPQAPRVVARTADDMAVGLAFGSGHAEADSALPSVGGDFAVAGGPDPAPCAHKLLDFGCGARHFLLLGCVRPGSFWNESGGVHTRPCLMICLSSIHIIPLSRSNRPSWMVEGSSPVDRSRVLPWDAPLDVRLAGLIRVRHIVGGAYLLGGADSLFDLRVGAICTGRVSSVKCVARLCSVCKAKSQAASVGFMGFVVAMGAPDGPCFYNIPLKVGIQRHKHHSRPRRAISQPLEARGSRSTVHSNEADTAA